MSEFPYVLRDSTGCLHYPAVAMEESFHAVRAVYRSLPYNTICDTTIERFWIGPARPAIYRNDDEASAQEQLEAYRLHALEHGATPEAVRLLGTYKPWTKKEEAVLADKLKSKAAKADKPVGGGGKAAESKPKGKGNPEALKKAREARAEAGPDVRKITIKNKENPYREGSNRAASFDALKGAKTVEDYKTAGGKTKYLSRWVEEGRIELK